MIHKHKQSEAISGNVHYSAGLLFVKEPPDSLTFKKCITDSVEIPCGFVNANPHHVEVIWHITKINGEDIYVSTNTINSANNGLRWMLNLPKGSDDRSPDSILIVDQVSEDDNRSTYQCSIGLPGDTKLNSSIGTLRVIGMMYMHIITAHVVLSKVMNL